MKIKLDKVSKAKCQFTSVVASTEVNEYIANNLYKLVEENVLCGFEKFLHTVFEKVNELRQEIKQGNLKDILDKHFDKFVKSVYEMEQKVIDCFKLLDIKQY